MSRAGNGNFLFFRGGRNASLFSGRSKGGKAADPVRHVAGLGSGGEAPRPPEATGAKRNSYNSKIKDFAA